MLTESLFTLLLLVAIGLLVRSRQIDSTAPAGAAGVVLALAMLVRPVAEYLPVVIVVVLVLVARGTIPPRRTAALALAFLVGFAVPGGAWLLRNYERTGVPIISTIDGHNMLQYRAVGALVESGQPRQVAQHDVLVRLAPHVRPGENAARVSRAELRVGLTILREHPVGALRDWAKGEARLLLGPARTETAVLLTGRESVKPAVGCVR